MSPVYAFRCAKCEHLFERTRPMSEYKEPAPCPECGELAERTLTPTAFSINGYSYRNGYSKK